MAQVDISIGERRFAVSCQDGEEDQLRKLAALVDEKARMTPQFNGLTESRMLLFASLLLADELETLRQAPAASSEPVPASPSPTPAPPPAVAPAIDEGTVKALEKLAERAEAIAAGLEDASASS